MMTSGSEVYRWRRSGDRDVGAAFALKIGVFCSVVVLQAATNRFGAEHNEIPRPLVWRADLAAIIAAHSRGFQALESAP